MNEKVTTEQESMDAYMIRAIIKAKNKEKAAEKKLIRVGFLVIFSLISLTVYVFKNWMHWFQVEGSIFQTIITDPYILFLTILFIITFAWLQQVTLKFEKAEKDYDQLKEDMIDRAADIWSSPDDWKKRPDIFRELKEKHDINLYHK
ncbi:YpbF family protein [Salipaludibacillus sp. LMS25]|uniref:DUF2663 family protein n=1 Tax=Salipaludibacillus sp. LMS25 TaxID=2924031 RepID=UPI0020D0436D|nr:DUF2663 family protein [Salipaludibacillus sp. LMS25]UTR14603.1 YpbF family protein [Salipaludibacillus sp. LMS25]